jgi:hypothetical protein
MLVINIKFNEFTEKRPFENKICASGFRPKIRSTCDWFTIQSSHREQNKLEKEENVCDSLE